MGSGCYILKMFKVLIHELNAILFIFVFLNFLSILPLGFVIICYCFYVLLLYYLYDQSMVEIAREKTWENFYTNLTRKYEKNKTTQETTLKNSK